MIEKLEEKTASALFLQQRIPAEYSATEQEHNWHCLASTNSVDVDGDPPVVVFEKAQRILAAAPVRNDIQYRVVLMITSREGWVLM